MLPTHAAFIYTRWLLSIASFIVCCLSPMNNLPGERKPYASENCVLVQVEPKAKKHSKTASEENSKRKGQEALEQEPQVRQKLRTLCPEEYTSHASFLTFMWFLPYALFCSLIFCNFKQTLVSIVFCNFKQTLVSIAYSLLLKLVQFT